jgi:hypothetical protein
MSALPTVIDRRPDSAWTRGRTPRTRDLVEERACADATQKLEIS